jgi:hypothetical protein
MKLRSTVVGVDLLRNTRAFLSFQMVQLVSMARDAIALRFWTSLLDKLAHKVRMDRLWSNWRC